MNKPWVGYLGSAFIFLAAIFMLVAGSYVTAGLLFVVAVAGTVLKYKMNRKG